MQKDFNQRGKSGKTEGNDDDGLSIFGYSCKMFPHCEKADFVAEERHLQSWNGDGSLRLDRYDCRLLLTRIDDRPREDEEEACPTEQMEEEMCDEERYKDMYLDIQSVALKEQEEKKKKAEITFDYGTTTVGQTKEEEDSDSEDEPFEPPPGIRLPVGLATPDNLKQSHIIERTAMFVVSKGPQMEIVIKAKQRNNAEQFGFLEFDNVLYPYYKYISKLIREKKYTPDFTKKKEKAEAAPVQKKPANALAAIAAEHSDSDDSDSDCELHPSLFAVKKREPSPDIIDRTRNAAGPRQKPVETSPVRPNYDIKQSNDMYASLFKSLTGYTDPPPQKKKEVKVEEVKKEPVVEPVDSDVDIEWKQWWVQFYGSPAPGPGPKPMIPPPPDMEPIVQSYAQFVARHGAQAELSLVARPDLKLHFMDPNSPFFSYYQHRVRYAQWELAQTNEVSTSTSTSQAEPAPAPEAPINRKQRRRLQDAQKVGPAPPPGVVDPVALKTIDIIPDLHKTQSCPANLGATEAPVPEPPRKPYMPTGGPVSFTLAKEESKLLPVKTVLGDEDDPLTAMLVNSPPGSSSDADSARVAIDDLMSKAPEPPAIQNNQQLDRKEKARVFMEKLLKEKRNTKVREAEKAKLRQLEQQKMELEQELAEEDKSEEVKEEEKKMDLNAGKTLDLIDQMINSRIDNLLQSTGIALVQQESSEKKEDNERKRSRESKKHKHKRKRSRSHSRSRDRSRDREYRRRRSRSRSKERDSRDSRRRRYH